MVVDVLVAHADSMTRPEPVVNGNTWQTASLVPKRPCCAAPGYLGNESLPPVVASMTVQMCSAADLGPALGTMLTRLFPHIFRVRALGTLLHSPAACSRSAQQRSNSLQAASRMAHMELVSNCAQRITRTVYSASDH